ncbi:MAG: outer membrane protein assembly factor BamB family protein [Actinomycetota bacterium]
MRARVLLTPILTCTLLAACSGGTPKATPTTPPPSSSGSPTISPTKIAGAWPVYHHDAGRSGVADDQTALRAPHQAWTSPVLDALVYAQPLVVDGHVIVATERNSVYSLDASSGSIVWKQNLGTPVDGGSLPCGNINPTGITGTPAIDPSSGTIYVVAFLKGAHHELFALDLASGATRWHRPIDPPGLSPAVEQERGALALGNGRVYVPFGGLTGDCGPYKGAVVSSATSGTGALQSYVVPTSREGGIWTPSGPVLDAQGNVWVSTGNTASTGAFDYGNAIIRLGSDLTVDDYFAPTDWAALNAGDVDLGSVGPVLLPNDRAFAAGKAGIVYLLDRITLGHIGGQIASQHVCSRAFGQPSTNGSTVFVACEDSLVAVRVTGDRLQVAWKSSGGSGPSILAAGVVWTLKQDGRLMAFDLTDGKTRFSAPLRNPATRFIAPSAAGGLLFVADRDRIIAFSVR